MEIFERTRLRIGNYMLARRMTGTSRKVSYSNINNVKKIGIIWDASRPEEFINLSRFYQKMSERNIEVSIIAYYPGKKLPDMLTAIRYLTCIRRDEVNFFYRPVAVEAEKFISQKFDVLIDINFNRIFPLVYLTTLSAACFKVGLFDPDEKANQYQLMIELKKPVKIDYYLTEVLNYLEMIKS